MEQDAPGAGNDGDSRDVIDNTDFVVGVHDTDQDSVLTNCVGNRRCTNQTLVIGIEISDFKVFLLEMLAAVQHRLVFNTGGDDVPSLVTVKMRHALEGKVV